MDWEGPGVGVGWTNPLLDGVPYLFVMVERIGKGGVGWTGLGWAGLGWAGLGWAGLGLSLGGAGWGAVGWGGVGWGGVGWGGVGWGRSQHAVIPFRTAPTCREKHMLTFGLDRVCECTLARLLRRSSDLLDPLLLRCDAAVRGAQSQF